MQNDRKIINLKIDIKSGRADTVLSEVIGKSRSYIKNLIEKNLVTVNGKSIKKSDKLKIGDEIYIQIPEEEKPDNSPVNLNLNILYETDNYAIIDKPAGIAVHHAPGNMGQTLVNGILYEFDIDDEDIHRPGIVHRLDKDTSGLLIVVKNDLSRKLFTDLFKARKIDKYYFAVCYGNPNFSFIEIDKPIGREPRNRQKMAVIDEGKQAISRVKIIEKFNNFFYAEIQILTGRTHQIRVHMKAIGYPLIGDKTYAPNHISSMYTRQALHAERLVFTDPFSSHIIDVKSPIPEELLSIKIK